MARSNGIWRKLPRWMKPAGVASATLFAGFTSLADPPKILDRESPRVVSATPVSAVRDDRQALLADLGAERWHRQGWRGQGVKIAVLDSGFRGYKAGLGSCLPSQIRTKSFRLDGDLEARDNQHGILCAEVVHALAPEAEILLANWEPDSPEAFLQALRWAKSQGVRGVTCSVVMPIWSDGEGGGPTHAALREILGSGESPQDMAFFASAGNLAQRHWAGQLMPDASRRHQWAPGQHLNRLLPWGTERVAIEVYGPVRRSCQLQVFDRETGRLVQQADLSPQIVGDRAWGRTAVRFDPEPRREYDIALRCLGGDPLPGEAIHVVVLGGHLERHTARGSIPFPGDGEGVITLGAVDPHNRRLDYSSCGPNSARPKPDFVAQVPFPSRFRAKPFTGTSASAPQGVGLAALLWSRDESQTPRRIHETLRMSSVDLLTPGHDGETGYGLIRLPE